MEIFISVAIADNHPIIIEGLRNILNGCSSQWKFNIAIEALNSKELIAKIENSMQPPDVCVLDPYMPDMDARSILPLLKRRWPNMGILVLTLERSENIAIEMLLAGANGFLLKNSKPQTLAEAIATIHKDGIFFSDLVSKPLYIAIKRGLVKLNELKPIQQEILKHACQHPELKWREIADRMHLTPKALAGHKDTIYTKLNVHNRSELLKYAIENRLIDIT